MTAETMPDGLRETLSVFEEWEPGTPATTSEVTERLDVGRRSTYERLERLVDREYLESKKVGARGRVWWRPPSSRDATVSGDGDARGSDQSGVQFRTLVEAVEEYAIFRLDVEGRVRTWNPGAEKIKGYAPEDIIGEHFSTFYTDGDRRAGVPERNLEAAAEEGETEDEGWRVRADGSRFWANVTITAIRDDDGELRGFAKVTRDMTERREREQRLRREKAFTQSILDNQRDLVYAFDSDGSILRWNDRLREVTGYADSEIEGMSPEAFIADEAADELADAHAQLLEHGESATVELPLVTADGERIPYEFTGGSLTNDSGAVVGFTGVGRDISDRKARMRRLERQRNDLKSELDEVFDRIDDAVHGLDEEWRFTYINDRAEELFGHSEAELIGKNVWEAFPGERPYRERYERAMEDQEPVTFEEYSDAAAAWLEVTVYPSETGLSIYSRDVTERRERERELELYRTIVEEARDGVYVLDGDLRFEMVNGAYEEMTGYDREELLGEHCSLVFDDEAVRPSARSLDDVVRGETDGATLEADVRRAGGGTLRSETKFTSIEDDETGDRRKIGVVRDVTEQWERERTLERRVRQQEGVTRLGKLGLEDHDLDHLFETAAEVVAETLGNEFCKVLDLDDAGEELRLRQGVGWHEGVVGEATVSATDDDSQAAYTLSVDGPVVVEDLTTETRFSGPDLLTDHDVRSGISVVVGPRDDPWGILGTHDTEPREAREDDVRFVQAVANVLATAIERHRYETRLRQQREQLDALNSLNEVVQNITEAVVDRSTREEIERAVVEGLTDADSFSFAWIGEVDGATQEVSLREEAGVEDYLDGITISADPDDDRSSGPTAQALLTGELQVAQDVQSNSGHDPWRDHVEVHEFRSSAALPVVHEGTTYGVLNVYSDRPNAFGGAERQVLTRLGEVVGYAIAAVDRKRALMSDEVVELEFQINDVFRALGIDAGGDGRITLDQAVPASDGSYLVYGTATESAWPAVGSIVDAISHWEAVEDLGQQGDVHRFEVTLTEPPVLSTVASRGGYVQEAVIADGDYHMTVHLPPTVETRSITDAVRDAYPTADLVTVRQFSRTDDAEVWFEQHLQEDLTERQLAAVEAAFHAGFYEWPRESDGADVADSLGVSPPTFHQHRRRAEQKILGALLTGPMSSDDAVAA